MTVPQALRLTEPIHTHGSRSDSFAPNGAKPQIRIPYRPTNRLLAPFALQPTILSDPRLFVHGCAQQTVSFRTQPLETKSCVNQSFFAPFHRFQRLVQPYRLLASNRASTTVPNPSSCIQAARRHGSRTVRLWHSCSIFTICSATAQAAHGSSRLASTRASMLHFSRVNPL